VTLTTLHLPVCRSSRLQLGRINEVTVRWTPLVQGREGVCN